MEIYDMPPKKSKPKLSWISDADLLNAVTGLLKNAQSAKTKASTKFGRNVLDPFSAIFEIAGFDMTFANWKKAEEARQAQKTLQNFIGEFHQTILGSCKDWSNMHTGKIIDLLNTNAQVIAEVKNKHNTISGGKLSDLYWSMESAVMDKTSIYKKYTAYHVAIIPKKKKPYNEPFTPSDKKKGSKCPSNPLIRQIDGASFYELVTGDKNALKDLFNVLPSVIAEITSKNIYDKKLEAIFKGVYG